MRRSDVTPYLRASQDTVQAEKWELEFDGSYSELEETLPTWDQNTTLVLRCLCDVDVERLQQETGVASHDMAWSIGWRVQETGLVSDPTLSPLRDDGKHEFHLTLRPEKTGPTLEITRSIVLRTTRVRVSPVEARWAGSVLWEDVTRLRLGSTTADFPIALLEFASSHLRRFRHNSWYLDLPDSRAPVDADTHPDQFFAATGGSRVVPAEVARLRGALEALADEHGLRLHPTPSAKIRFDRASAPVIRHHMDITCFEATQPGVWNFLATVAMPRLTLARFGVQNRERWLASDLTRHMFSRLWWQSYTFGVTLPDGSVDYGLLSLLSESDLNQLTERRSIGGIPRLAQEVARQYLATDPGARREAIRSVTRTINRSTPFLALDALTDADLHDFVARGFTSMRGE